MDKTKAVNPSNKAKLAIAVNRLQDHINDCTTLYSPARWVQIERELQAQINKHATAFVLSEEG